MRAWWWGAAVLSVVGCGSPKPETASEFFRIVGEDWCTCVQDVFPETWAEEGMEESTCADQFGALMLFVSSDDGCTYDPEAAKRCLDARAEPITCLWGTETTVLYDGVAFEDLADCAAAYPCRDGQSTLTTETFVDTSTSTSSP